MPKVRIDNPAYANFNGRLSGFQFVDGVSTTELSLGDAKRLGGLIRVVDADTGLQLSRLQDHADTSEENRKANRQREAELAEQQAADEAAANAANEAAGPPVVEPVAEISDAPAGDFDFTEESLAAVADANGIEGLREIADPFDIRGRSVKNIIDQLLALKKNAEAKANS